MALQVLLPLSVVAGEIARVLRPGGHLAAIVPATSPLNFSDFPVAAGLSAALGRRLGYPNDSPLARPEPLLRQATAP